MFVGVVVVVVVVVVVAVVVALVGKKWRAEVMMKMALRSFFLAFLLGMVDLDSINECIFASDHPTAALNACIRESTVTERENVTSVPVSLYPELPSPRSFPLPEFQAHL